VISGKAGGVIFRMGLDTWISSSSGRWKPMSQIRDMGHPLLLKVI